MNLNLKGKADHTYDAIVVGSGISGGWAAKELCQKGLKTLVLERGRDVKHIEDYTTINSAPWQLSHQNKPTQKMLADQSVQNRTGYTVTLETTEYFAKIIFLNASTVASTSILMHSKSSRFSEGMDESGSLGHNLMDHHLGVGADGILETHADKTT